MYSVHGNPLSDSGSVCQCSGKSNLSPGTSSTGQHPSPPTQSSSLTPPLEYRICTFYLSSLSWSHYNSNIKIKRFDKKVVYLWSLMFWDHVSKWSPGRKAQNFKFSIYFFGGFITFTDANFSHKFYRRRCKKGNCFLEALLI